MGNIANIIHIECSHMQKDCVHRVRQIKATRQELRYGSLDKILCIHYLIMNACMGIKFKNTGITL